MPRLALVTGGLGAIGSAICDALAAQGCKVVALDHPSVAARAPEWLAAHPGMAAHFADLADWEATQVVLAEITAAHGAVDVLVNAAGITRDMRLVKMTREHWRAVLATNLDSAFNVCQPLFAAMCERGFGRIVNISSVNGQTGAFGQTNYAAAKAGLHGFTMSLAREGAAKGVTVNSVAPGFVTSPMTAAMRPDVLDGVIKSIPVGRPGTPSDIARAVAFLCHEDAGYITGVQLPVNGGLLIGP